jgi:hypothetical protein
LRKTEIEEVCMHHLLAGEVFEMELSKRILRISGLTWSFLWWPRVGKKFDFEKLGCQYMLEID